ncbi:MAG: LPS export ABC transporter periplasmic protein LptC [Acidobacteriia bacterium]|nr:LPS export ABC transporter periplasmic protein LptC [Terriglobia bacterium]
MPVNISRLRVWFATATIVLAVVVAGFYFYGRMRMRRAIKEVPQQLGVNIQQSTQGFTFSKSEGGRTLFTVHAARAVQYKESGKAELRDVTIIVYGRQSNRYDQIYGADFEYDPRTGDVTAKGEVRIDLEGNAEGPLNPDQAAPAELKNPIHLKTSGLMFNAKTGLAGTRELIEFRVPQANGSALGAVYDSTGATLTLASNIQVHSTDPSATNITAQHGVITKGPNRAVLQGVRITRDADSLVSNELTVYLRDDNTIAHIAANGDVRAQTTGQSATEVRSARAEAWITEKNALRTAAFSGGVALNTAGEHPLQGTAGKVTVSFAARNLADKVVASEGVKLLQPPRPGRSAHPVEIAATTIDFLIQSGRTLQQAVTGGPAQVTVLPLPGALGQDAAQTVATAGRFEARFNRQNRIDHLTGAPEAKVVSLAPGQPRKTSTSDRLDVTFNAAGGIATIFQDGQFHYSEPAPPGGNSNDRAAWADHARYAPGEEALTLTGSPRVVDGGLTTTAETIRLDRRSGDVMANGDVKSTYSELKPQAGGALLASGDPVHVTAPTMRAVRGGGTAVYSGGARLWQGSSIVGAPVIEFNRDARKLVARSLTSNAAGAVTTTFVQRDQKGKLTPVSVRSALLTYLDGERRGSFEGGVVVRGADTTLTADKADVYLQARGQSASSAGQPGPSQIDRIVADGHVNIQEPNRRATGERLVYTGSEGKFVLTGGSPSIFDAERGKITGASLTFYNRDDRVVVEANTASPTVTQTRVAK